MIQIRNLDQFFEALKKANMKWKLNEGVFIRSQNDDYRCPVMEVGRSLTNKQDYLGAFHAGRAIGMPDYLIREIMNAADNKTADSNRAKLLEACNLKEEA